MMAVARAHPLLHSRWTSGKLHNAGEARLVNGSSKMRHRRADPLERLRALCSICVAFSMPILEGGISSRYRWRFGLTVVTLVGRGCFARQEPYIPGALSILQGTVPDRVRGSGHMVPTYFRRCSGIECFNGHCGFALLFFVDEFVFVSPFQRSRRTPRRRGIQYAAALRLKHERSGILDHPLSRMMTPNLTPLPCPPPRKQNFAPRPSPNAMR
jgi:hypothetical protein